MENYFKTLNEINVNDKIEKKNGLTYLSWAFAWGEAKKLFPNANYKVYETLEGVNYWNDGKTAWVKTGVTIQDIEHIEYLPIMDFKNKSITLSALTSFDVNKAIQRSLTKAIARHGLGLYIYAGEDLPEGAEDENVSPYSGKKPEGVTSVQLKTKFTEIKNELEASADLKTLTAVWLDYQPDLKVMKEFDQQSYDNLERIKNEAKKLYA